MSSKVKLDKLADAVNELLEDYGDYVTEGMKEAVKMIAREARDETKSASPKRTGKYRRWWAIRDTSTRMSAKAIVHNRTDYQLTHLLEKGHALKRGGRTIGRVKAFPHIGPAEKRAVKNFKKAVEKLAEG